jgi:drug/metabolite transporter (DMT)-like permease
VDVFMEICQGLGLALAVGIGGPIAALFISMMGSLDAGIHPDGSDYGFLSATWFLVTLLALVVIAMLARNRPSLRIPTIAVLAAIGAIVSAASFAENGDTAWPGLVLGAAAAAFAAVVSFDVLGGAIDRAEGNEPGSREADAANVLIIGFAAAGIVLAAVCLFVPPVSLLALAALGYLALSRRRKADEKYEGLRILR